MSPGVFCLRSAENLRKDHQGNCSDCLGPVFWVRAVWPCEYQRRQLLLEFSVSKLVCTQKDVKPWWIAVLIGSGWTALLWVMNFVLQARVWLTGSTRSAVFTDYNCQCSRHGKRIRHRSCFCSPFELWPKLVQFFVAVEFIGKHIH